SNEIVPEVPDVCGREQGEDEQLCEKCRKKHRGSRNSTNKESRQEETENAAIKDGAQDVACFEQILDQTCKRRDADSNQTPCRRQRLGRDYIMMIARVWPNQWPIKIDRGGGPESV